MKALLPILLKRYPKEAMDPAILEVVNDIKDTPVRSEVTRQLSCQSPASTLSSRRP
jgi:hypothetical protein